MKGLDLANIFSWLGQISLLLVSLIIIERLIKKSTVNIKEKSKSRSIFWFKWSIRLAVFIFATSISFYLANIQSFTPLFALGKGLSGFLSTKTASILAIIAISYIAILLINLFSSRIAVNKSFNRNQIRLETLRNVFFSSLRVVIIGFAVINILNQFGVNVTALLAGVSIIGLAVSFGSQSLVKDIINGFFVLFEDQYGVGDVIRINGTQLSGTVETLSLRATVLRDLEGTVHIIPNGQILTVSVLSKDWGRAVVDIEVSHSANLDEVIELIERVSNDFYQDLGFKERFLEPPEVLGVQSLTASGAVIRTLMKVMPKEQWSVARELRKRLKNALDEAGVDIAMPKMNLEMKERPK